MTPLATVALEVLLTLVIALAAYGYGRRDGAEAPRAQLAALSAATNAQKERYDESSIRLSRALLRANEIATRERQEASKIAASPLYRSTICLDDVGVRVANSALAGVASGTDAALPAAAPAH